MTRRSQAAPRGEGSLFALGLGSAGAMKWDRPRVTKTTTPPMVAPTQDWWCCER